MPRQIRTCERCGKQFSDTSGREARFCSMECRSPAAFAVCERCGKQFRIKPQRTKTARYCSLDCYNQSRKKKPRPKQEGYSGPMADCICQQCGKSFSYPKRFVEKGDGKFCGHKCAAKYRNVGQLRTIERVEITCLQCGKPFLVYPRDADARRFCNRACQQRWKGPTSIETKLMYEMDARGIAYESQYPLDTLLLDFAFPDIRLCVEADGDYWHSIPGAKERDCNRDQTLARCGWTTLRFSETKINASTEQCVDEIARVIQDLKNSAHL